MTRPSSEFLLDLQEEIDLQALMKMYAPYLLAVVIVLSFLRSDALGQSTEPTSRAQFIDTALTWHPTPPGMIAGDNIWQLLGLSVENNDTISYSKPKLQKNGHWRV